MENDPKKPLSRNEPESLQGQAQEKNIDRRNEYQNLPESGWEAGQGISNTQFVAQRSDEDQNGTQRGPADAGIGMEEVRKKKEGSWGSGSDLE